MCPRVVITRLAAASKAFGLPQIGRGDLAHHAKGLHICAAPYSEAASGDRLSRSITASKSSSGTLATRGMVLAWSGETPASLALDWRKLGEARPSFRPPALAHLDLGNDGATALDRPLLVARFGVGLGLGYFDKSAGPDVCQIGKHFAVLEAPDNLDGTTSGALRNMRQAPRQPSGEPPSALL